MTLHKPPQENHDRRRIAFGPSEVMYGELDDLVGTGPPDTDCNGNGNGNDETPEPRGGRLRRLMGNLGRGLLAVARWFGRVARRFAASLCGVLVAVVIGAAGATFVLTLPPSVTAQGAFALRPQPDGPVAADTVTLLAQEYLSYATSPAVVAQNARSLGIVPRAARESVTGSVGQGTAVVRLDVKLPDAAEAVALDGRILRAAVLRARNDELLDADIVVEPTAASVHHNPPRLILLAADALAACTACGLVWYVLRGRKRHAVARGRATAPATAYGQTVANR